MSGKLTEKMSALVGIMRGKVRGRIFYLEIRQYNVREGLCDVLCKEHNEDKVTRED